MSRTSDTDRQQTETTSVQDYPAKKARQAETVLDSPRKRGTFVAWVIGALAVAALLLLLI